MTQTPQELVGKPQRRAMDMGRAYTPETRSLSLAFASETPVPRFYGNEVLSCEPANVDLSRVVNGAPLLRNHNPDEHIGGIESASVDADRVCRAVAKLSRNATKEEADITDGILRKVSVGYTLDRVVSKTKAADGVETWVWAWSPYEISLVSLAADDSVGVGRSKDSVNVEVVETEKPKERTMSETKPVVNEAAEILDLGIAHKMVDEAAQAVRNGVSLDAFRKVVLDAMSKRAPQSPTIGMSDKEVKRFSMFKVIRAMANIPTDIGFERECSQQVERVMGKAAKGLFVPHDVLQAARALQIADAGTGGAVVATNLMAGSFIQTLRAKLALQALGVPVMTGLVGDVAFPRGGAMTAVWANETDDASESTPSLDQVTGTPKALGCYANISRKLLVQSSLDVEGYVRDELAAAIAKGIDKAGFAGTGTKQPIGLLTGPISTDVAVTAGTPTFAEVANILATLEGKDLNLDNVKWAMASNAFWKLATTPTSTAASTFLADYNAMRCLGRQAVVSSNIPTKMAIAGDWSQMIVGIWGALDITVDPYTLSKSQLVSVVGWQDADVMIRNAGAFAHADILT